MTDAERAALKKKYTPEKLKAIRTQFDEDVQGWAGIQRQMDLDIQCISTDKDDGTPAGPWPEQEWYARTSGMHKRPCNHEDVLTQYVNQLVNQIEMNPLGVEAQPMGDGADNESAEFLEGRIRNIEYEEHAQIAYLTAAKTSAECSVGFWKMETKARGDGRQKICIEEIQDPKSVIPGYFKKAAGLDMRRCWELDRMTHAEFKEKYPQAKIKSFEGDNLTIAPRWISDNTVQVAALWHLEEDEWEWLTINTPEGQTEVSAEGLDEDALKDLDIVKRERKTRVLKTILNGVEALDETEWIDPGDGEAYPPEIPVMVVTGRVKYEKGVRVIESLVRKGRIGQLLYDYVISAIQEVLALTPRVHYLGAEGQFDSNSDFNPRNIVPYKEYVPKTAPEGNELLPAPQLQTYEPPIQALELAKQSILIGIQNAIGMSSTERKDRASKSGKAIDAMREDMTVATAHYFGALRVAQERGYRILQRILPLIESDSEEVGIRDKYGKTKMAQPLYQGRHSVAVGTGRLYQTLQEKQEETADELMKIGDPNILLAVLPGAIRMKGLGKEYAEPLARMIESLQPPQMQAARDEKQEMPPEAMQAIQQLQEQLKTMDAYAKDAEQKIIELEDKLNAKVVESQSREKISSEDNDTKIEIEQMKIDAQLALKEWEFKIAEVNARISLLTKGAELDSKEHMQGREHQHSSQEGEASRNAAAEEAERNRIAAAEQASEKETQEA